MDIEIVSGLRGAKRAKWIDFLSRAGLEADEGVTHTALVWDGDELIATGSRQDGLLKCIAVDDNRQGEGLTATVLTALRQDAFRDGHRHLFLYTKPQNRTAFSSLFFYPVAQTDRVLLMEDKQGGIDSFLQALAVPCKEGRIGALVMNCNPFTLGHQYLIEQAASQCDHVYIFVLSEDKSRFSAADRLEMVKLGTAHLKNVTVSPSGPYLISSATFPTYFLKDRDLASQVHCQLDIEIFSKRYVPNFGITHRFIGTEQLSPMTALYNRELLAQLPRRGIQVVELPRLEKGDVPISASAVRARLDAGEDIRELVPETTYRYLCDKNLLNQEDAL